MIFKVEKVEKLNLTREPPMEVKKNKVNREKMMEELNSGTKKEPRSFPEIRMEKKWVEEWKGELGDGGRNK